MLCVGLTCAASLLRFDHLPMAVGLGAVLGILAWLVVAMLVLVRRGDK